MVSGIRIENQQKAYQEKTEFTNIAILFSLTGILVEKNTSDRGVAPAFATLRQTGSPDCL